MNMQQKYVWDIAVENNYRKKKLRIVNEVSQMVSYGGDVRNMQKKLHLLNLL
jgi:hypothetical protein